MIRTALKALEAFCAKGSYKGWDPFDGLTSRLFRSSLLNQYPLFRLAWIQLFKRSPINLRRVFLVPTTHNAKGLALFASAYTGLGETEKAARLLSLMKPLAAPSAQGSGWGYNFDWQARAFYVPAGTPNMVATVFVAHAFLDFYEATGTGEAREAAMDAQPETRTMVRRLLDSQRFAVLSTQSEKGPYCRLVSFWAAEDLSHVLFATMRDTRKFANMHDHPRVALLFDDRSNRDEDVELATAVTATGEARELTDGVARAAGAAGFLAKHPQLSEFVGSPGCALVRVDIATYYVVTRFQNVVELHTQAG